MLFAACMMAVALSAAELNVFASGLKAVQDGNKVDITYVLNANATAGEIQLLDAAGAVVKAFPAPNAAILTKGKHTINLDLSDAGVPAGNYNWAVKVTGAATEALTQVTETAEGSTWVAADSALIFYAPRGLAINTNPENANFGLIYVSSPCDGDTDGGSTYSQNHKKGLYVINPDLTLVNEFNVPYLGGLTWPGASTAPYRLALDADGALYLSGNNAALAGVWKANTADLTANFTPVTTATNFTGITGITVADGVVYGLDNVGTGAANSQLIKITADKVDTIAHLEKLANANCSLAADGKGGFWVFQNRWGADTYFCFFHVTATGEMDWSAVRYDETQSKFVSDYLPFSANISYRGAMAVNRDYTKLIVGSDKSGVVFDITWTDGKPDLKEAYRTPQLTNNIDGVGFDYADNIYVLSAGVERLYAFAPVKADNTCVTPAPKANTIAIEEKIEVDATKPYTLKFNLYDSTSSDSGTSYSKDSKPSDIFTAATAPYVASIEDGTDKVYAARTTSAGVECGIKFGTSSVAGVLSFVLAYPAEVDSVVISAAKYGDSEGAEGFSVNGTAYTLSAGNKKFEDLVFKPTGTLDTITITQTKASKGRFYMNGITIYPKAAVVDMGPIDHSWFAATESWDQETASTATWDATNKVVKVSIKSQKNSQWKAQVFVNTSMEPINAVPEAGKKYDISVKMKADKEVGGVTLKYQDNAQMIYEDQAIKLLAGEEYVYTKEAVDGLAGNNMFVFDFGWAAAETNIDIYDIVIKEHEDVVASKVWEITPTHCFEGERTDGYTLYVTLARGAQDGDTIVLADGVYDEGQSMPVEHNVVIMAAEGAHPVIQQKGYFQIKASAKFEGIKFQFVGEDKNGYCMYFYENNSKSLEIENCEFQDFKQYCVSSWEDYHVDSCIVNNCYFHNLAKGPFYFKASGRADLTNTCDKLKVTNCTFADIDINGYVSVIDFRNDNGEGWVGNANEMLVDHCTFYNIHGEYNRIIMSYKSANATVSNCIIANPTNTEFYPTYNYGGSILNNLTYNTKDHRSGPTKTGNITGDPLFKDAANLDFTLGEGSPALNAGTDGSHLGDPRWYPAAGPVVPVTKTVATVEKLWSRTLADIGATTADSRQGAGYNGVIYVLNKANHSLVAITENKKDTIVNGNIINGTDTIALDGTAYALDDAGNFVMEGTFPSKPSHLVVRKADGSEVHDLAIEGLARTDFINATGDVFSEEGGYVFVYGNSASGLLVYKIAKGAIVNTTTVNVAGASGGNYVIAGNDTKQIAHHRTSENGWVLIDNGVATTIENMEGFKKTTLGGDIITLAEKEFYIYPAGSTNYNSEFSVRNMTDGAMVVDKADATKTIFFANDVTKQPGATSTANWLIATPIDANNAYIHLYNAADGVALFKLSVMVAAEVTVNYDETMGTVEGAGDVAVGANATLVATPKPGYEFVAWKDGDKVVSTDATYIFKVEGNVTLTAVFEARANVTITLAVNDAAMGSITLPEGIVMGENSVLYGTPIVLTAVPAEGVTFAGWFKGAELYAPEYTINLTGKESISLLAKFITSKTIVYDLGGGITNDYGWTGKGDMFADFVHTADPSYEFQTLEYYMAQADPLGSPNICTGLNHPEVAFADSAKWGWLYNYIIAVSDAQRETDSSISNYPANGAGAAWRYAVGAFFCNIQREGWPRSADFSVAGKIEAFQPTWKHAFANPTTVDAEFVLNDPYKDGWTFMGWYTEPEGKGTKVTTINIETEGTLYAYFVPYINTVAEFIAMADGTKGQQVRGTVTFVQGSNFWIQDATGGILCYGKNNGLKEGDVAVLNGDKTTYNGSPEVNNAVVVSKEAGAELEPQTIALSAIKNYLNKLVYIEGLKMAEYQPVYKADTISYYNPIVTDGTDSVVLYNMGVVESEVPVGTKVNIKTVVGIYKTTYQLRGKKEWVEASSLAGRDNYNYPVRHAEGDFAGYSLSNDWLYAVTYDNYSDNVPGPTDYVRGMAVKDGIMYFINRATASFTRVDGKTGIMLDPLPIKGEHLFEAEAVDSLGQGTGEWSTCVTLAYNDVKIDNAGNVLIGACLTSSQRFQVYKVDLETGNAVEVINERLWNDTSFAKISYRFDAFGVYGDVNNDATIMACDANSWNAFRWHIVGGKAQPAEQVILMPDESVPSYYIKVAGDTVDWNVASPGTAPQIFPLADDMFYVDGWSTLPILFDAGTQDIINEKIYRATIIDDFKNCPTGVAVVNNEGDTTKMNTGHNGLVEFQVGGDYFLAMAATNTVGNPTSAFALYKYKDAAKSFAEMEPLWYFPAKGMGALTNGCRTAVPSVEVKDNMAKIYVYTNNNGYGVYTFTGKTGTGINKIDVPEDVNARKVFENGVIYIYRNGVKYNVMGAKIK